MPDMAQPDVKRLARAFHALSNPNRLQLFLNLLEESRLDLAKGRVHDCFLAQLLGNLNVGDDVHSGGSIQKVRANNPTPSATASSSCAR